MGYDLNLAVTPAGLTEAWRSLQAAEQHLADVVAVAVAGRHEGLLDELGGRMTSRDFVSARDPNRFNPTMSAMTELREAMLECGMLIDGGTHPDFPAFDKDWAQDSRELAAYHREMQYALAFHPDGEIGIPWWKLSSNDGWHITALECDQALGLWQASGRRFVAHPWVGDPVPWEDLPVPWEHPPHWADWLTYLVIGACSDGFYVY